MRQRLGDAVEHQADAHAGAEHHRDPGDGPELRPLVVPAQRDAAVPAGRQPEHVDDEARGEHDEEPARGWSRSRSARTAARRAQTGRGREAPGDEGQGEDGGDAEDDGVQPPSPSARDRRRCGDAPGARRCRRCVCAGRGRPPARLGGVRVLVVTIGCGARVGGAPPSGLGDRSRPRPPQGGRPDRLPTVRPTRPPVQTGRAHSDPFVISATAAATTAVEQLDRGRGRTGQPPARPAARSGSPVGSRRRAGSGPPRQPLRRVPAGHRPAARGDRQQRRRAVGERGRLGPGPRQRAAGPAASNRDRTAARSASSPGSSASRAHRAATPSASEPLVRRFPGSAACQSASGTERTSRSTGTRWPCSRSSTVELACTATSCWGTASSVGPVVGVHQQEVDDVVAAVRAATSTHVDVVPAGDPGDPAVQHEHVAVPPGGDRHRLRAGWRPAARCPSAPGRCTGRPGSGRPAATRPPSPARSGAAGR